MPSNQMNLGDFGSLRYFDRRDIFIEVERDGSQVDMSDRRAMFCPASRGV